MPTARTYVTKLLLGTALTSAFLIATPALMTTLAIALPAWMTSSLGVYLWRIDPDAQTELIRGTLLPILMVAVIFFFWRMEKFGKEFSPSTRKRYRRITITFLILLCYVLSIPIINLSAPSYKNCAGYSEKLNGGLRRFDDQTYRIELCGSGPDETGANDHIRLRIFDDEDAVQAIRYFRLDWDVNAERKLEYSDQHIIYFDHADQNDQMQTMSMPPSPLDWLRSRIPLLD